METERSIALYAADIRLHKVIRPRNAKTMQSKKNAPSRTGKGKTFDPSRSEFITSLPRWRPDPKLQLPIIVVAGRSNVGKSSFINMMLRRKSIARTSNTPGRTQLLNFFNVDGRFILADVPGYGFAKAPMSVVKSWTESVRDFVNGADNICGVLQLLDVRRKPSMEDIFFSALVAKSQNPLVHVITKADKLKRNQQAKQMMVIAEEMGVDKSDMLLTSAKDKGGRDLSWKRIFELLKDVPLEAQSDLEEQGEEDDEGNEYE
jgi:GTP-binding protein